MSATRAAHQARRAVGVLTHLGARFFSQWSRGVGRSRTGNFVTVQNIMAVRSLVLRRLAAKCAVYQPPRATVVGR